MIIIDTKRQSTGTENIHTMTVSELVSVLSGYDPDEPVFTGNGHKGGWYLYGGILECDITKEGENHDEH